MICSSLGGGLSCVVLFHKTDVFCTKGRNSRTVTESRVVFMDGRQIIDEIP